MTPTNKNQEASELASVLILSIFQLQKYLVTDPIPTHKLWAMNLEELKDYHLELSKTIHGVIV